MKLLCIILFSTIWIPPLKAQDLLILKSGKELNVLILNANDSLIFYRDKWKDHEIEVAKIEQLIYNGASKQQSNQKVKAPASMDIFAPNIDTDKRRQSTNMGLAIAGGLSFMTSAMCGAAYVLYPEPKEPGFGSTFEDQFAYNIEVNSYKYTQKLLLGTAIVSAGMGGMLLAIIHLNNPYQTPKNKQVSFRPSVNGFSVCYQLR